MSATSASADTAQPATSGPGGDRSRRLDPVWFLTVVVAALGAYLVGQVPGHPLSGAVTVPAWAIGIGYATTNYLSARTRHRGNAVDTALTGVPLLVGLAFSSTVELVAALCVATAATELLRADRWRKIAFNVALVPMQVAVIRLVLEALAGPSAFAAGFGGALALGLGVVLADQATLLAVSGAVRLSTGQRIEAGVLWRMFRFGLGTSVLSVPLGLLTIWAAQIAPLAGLVIGSVLLAVLALLLRMLADHIDRGRRLALLEQAVASLNQAGDALAIRDALIGHARELLEALEADLAIKLPNGAVHGPSDDPVIARVFETGQPVLHARRQLGQTLVQRPDANVAAVAVGREDDPDAVLVVRGCRVHVDKFDRSDIRVLTDLARHAASAIRRHQLVELLQHEIAAAERSARTDSLTQLPNRAGLLRTIEEGPTSGVLVLASARGLAELAAALGRRVADGLLLQLAGRLTTEAGPRACARLADATLAIWLRDATDPLQACERVRRALADGPIRVDEVELSAQLAFGAVALTPGVPAEEHLRCAEVALAADTGRPVAYTSELDEQHARRLRISRDLRQAIAEGQLSLHYQPKADLRTRQLVGVEALARWTHPELGAIPPFEFVELAERSGVIGELTSWAIREACRQAGEWLRAGRPLSVAVNLSPRDLLDPTLATTVAEALADAQLPAELLRLEITESVMVVELERSRHVVDTLRATGVSVSIDDFGSGYASFGHLRRFVVDELKIDRSLVVELEQHGDAIVRAIVALAEELGLKTVAEGVEDDLTWETLARAGVDACQGWVLAKPMDARDLTGWLTAYADHHALAVG